MTVLISTQDWGILLSPFQRWGNWAQRSCHMPEIQQLGKGWSRIQRNLKFILPSNCPRLPLWLLSTCLTPTLPVNPDFQGSLQIFIPGRLCPASLRIKFKIFARPARSYIICPSPPALLSDLDSPFLYPGLHRPPCWSLIMLGLFSVLGPLHLLFFLLRSST